MIYLYFWQGPFPQPGEEDPDLINAGILLYCCFYRKMTELTKLLQIVSSLKNVFRKN